MKNKNLLNLKSNLLEDICKEDIETLQIDIINSIPKEQYLSAFGKLKKFEKLIKGLIDSVIKVGAIDIYTKEYGGANNQIIDGVKYQLQISKKWKYSDEYYKLESDLKALADYEKKTGIAQADGDPTTIFKAIVL